MEKITDIGAKRLSAAVLRQVAKEIKTEQFFEDNRTKVAEKQVRNGNLDLFFDILDLKISKEDFIKRCHNY